MNFRKVRISLHFFVLQILHCSHPFGLDTVSLQCGVEIPFTKPINSNLHSQEM